MASGTAPQSSDPDSDLRCGGHWVLATPPSAILCWTMRCLFWMDCRLPLRRLQRTVSALLVVVSTSFEVVALGYGIVRVCDYQLTRQGNNTHRRISKLQRPVHIDGACH